MGPRYLALCVVCIAGCYHPSPQVGAPCAANDACPTGLVCRDDRCIGENEDLPPRDATAVLDAPVDVALIDALDSLVGCADGTREAFLSTTAFPNIAGCAATWMGARSMRAPATMQPCGNAQPCAAPADACAPGWHVCATSGDPMELVSKIVEADCRTAGDSTDMTARFVTAVSHCTAYQVPVCEYQVPRGCAPSLECSEPICCGQGCRYDVGCTASAFSTTGVAGTLDNGCATMLAADVTGVLCCR